MTKDRLAKLLKSPNSRDEDAISGLEEIVARYPYYTNGHILLTIQYKLLDHIRYENQLRRTSVHVPNRSILRTLVLSPTEIPMPGEPLPQNQIAETVSSPEPSAVITSAPMEVVKDVHSTEVATDLETVLQTPVSKQRKDPRDVIEERLRELKEQERAMREQLDLVLDRERTEVPSHQEKSGSAATQETNATNVPLEYKDINQPETITPAITAFDIPAETTPNETETAEINQQDSPLPNKQPSVLTKTGSRSFSDWLKVGSVASPVALSDGSDKKSAGYQLESAIQSKPVEGDNKSDLIDKFIREEPRIVPAKSEFYSPGNMARKSAQEHEDLISETLARIYAQQGRFDKAIVTYERLGLKLPEKKAYFASLIENLKKQS